MKIKLTELHPRWAVGSDWKSVDGVIFGNQDNYWKREGMGISFDCPHCRIQRLGVWFSNPIDGGIPQSAPALWKRTGDTFETLTLSPSVNTTETRIDIPSHWHGFIQDGYVS
jgi:hypothetical protein